MAELTEQQKQTAMKAFDETPGVSVKAGVLGVYAAGLAEGAKPQPASADDAETAKHIRDRIVSIMEDYFGKCRSADGEADRIAFAEVSTAAALHIARRGWVQADDVRRTVLEQRCERGTPWDLAVLACAEAIQEKYAPAPKQDAAVAAVERMIHGVYARSDIPNWTQVASEIVAAVRAADGGKRGE